MGTNQSLTSMSSRPTCTCGGSSRSLEKKKNRYGIAVAAEERGPGIGRIRLRRIPNATADSLQAFVQEAVAPGSLLHTDGLLSYDRLEKYGYRHRTTFVKGRKASASERFNRRTVRHRGKLFYRFGNPALTRALRSAADALTPVSQSVIRPYREGKTREMHLHRLPWPREALQALGDLDVTLR